MVGKIKHVRQKIHQEAVKLDRPGSLTQSPGTALPQSLLKPPVLGLHTISPPLLEKEKHDSSNNVKQVCMKNLGNKQRKGMRCWMYISQVGRGIGGSHSVILLCESRALF